MMRLRIGPVREATDFHPEQQGWHRLKEPTFSNLMLLALPTSVLLTIAMLAAWAALATLHGVEERVQFVVTPATLLVSIAALLALILAHELAHAAALPGGWLNDATTLGLWARKLTPYVAYDGALTRNRHIVVALMPFLLGSLVPLLAGLLLAWMPLGAVVLSTLNAFFSSGDLISVVLLVTQTPGSALVRNSGLETWWREMA